MIVPGIRIDETTRLPDTREGREVRILLAGYAEMLAQAAKGHEPFARLCEIKAELDDAMNRAIAGIIRNNAMRN